MEDLNINKLISSAPITLDVTNKDVIEVGNYYLPYSIGFEIECFKETNFNLKDFTTIPNIIDVNTDDEEQRFRIPKGIEGLNCLYNITLALKKNSLLYDKSGIHYHVDCTEMYDDLTSKIITDNKDWILEELDTWNYKGSYNRRNFQFNTSHNWLRCQSSFKTIECRIGEMTFEYDLLFKRITHLSDIIRRFKLEVKHHVDLDIITYDQDIVETLNNRTIRI
jgi:hypothetical protein